MKLRSKKKANPVPRRIHALSRCKCSNLVEEGKPHKCRYVRTSCWENPVMRGGNNPYRDEYTIRKGK